MQIMKSIELVGSSHGNGDVHQKSMVLRVKNRCKKENLITGEQFLCIEYCFFYFNVI